VTTTEHLQKGNHKASNVQFISNKIQISDI